ncbi:MAG: S9 family peptidase [Pseudomonadales bacterium]|jgi:dipeptidyl aminopeptidase/acylaminoacyl peptidase|nr:S9 family peptidase [Pseudomonadales bacterium]
MFRPEARSAMPILYLLTLLTCAASTWADAARRPMTVDDAMAMVEVGDPLISPDGSWVLYSKRTLDWEENEYVTEYWRASADGSDAYRFIGEDGGSDFRFSPQGTYLSFRRSVGDGDDKASQLFLMRLSGGEAVQLTEHETGLDAYEWAEDESAIYFEADDAKPEEVTEEEKNGTDAIFVDEGPNGQNADQWENLWVFDLETEESRQITAEKFLVSSWDVDAAGERIALTARDRNRRNDADRYEVYVADVETGALTQLTDNGAPESNVAFSPDGTSILYAAADDQGWMNRNTKLWLLDVESGEHRLLSGAFQGSPSDARFSPDGSRVYFNGQQGTNTHLFSLDVATGAVEQLTDLPGTLRVESFSEDFEHYAYTLSDYRTPPDVWVGSMSGHGVRVTDANPQIDELELAVMEVIQWRSKDEMVIEGLLHTPADRGPGERVPLMLNIHGGPAGVFANRWSSRYHVYAGLGYASLSPNVRGSRSYTDALREGNTVQQGDGIGFGDYWDLMNGVDRVIADGIADPDRLALRGWSYGGILGGWTITQTDRFKAASIGAGVYDWTSEYGPGFNNDVRLWHIGGTPWNNPEGYRHQSALTHAENVTTPTLLIHGMQDTTDTEQQSMMFYAALRDIGNADVRYIRFPREPHGFREPRHQRTRDIEEIRWMQKYVLGEEWTPWERPASEGEDEEEADDEAASVSDEAVAASD